MGGGWRSSAINWCRETRLFLGGRDIGHRQVPVAQQDLESPLFLALVSLLIGPELLDETLFVWVGGGRHRRVLVPDGDAIIPAPIFGGVVGGLLDFHREDTAALGLLHE